MATLEERQQAFLSARADLQTVLRAFNEGNRQVLDYLAVRMEQHGQHRETIGNAHNLTKEHFNLGNVVNQPLATLADIDNLNNLERYLTPFTYKKLIEKLTVEGNIITNQVRNPKPIFPINDATTPTQGITLVADEYRNVYNMVTEDGVTNFPRKYRHFQVDYYTGDYTTPLWERYVDDQDVATINTALPAGADLKWRCRDITTDDHESNWSVPGTFTTSENAAFPPSVEIEGHPGRVPDKPYIRASAFQNTGIAANLTATEFILYPELDETVLWEKVNVAGNMNEVWLPEHLLEPNTRYRIEVTQHSDVLPPVTSMPVTFRTANHFPFQPGKRWLNWGDEQNGIYDEVPQSEFITTSELLVSTGLTAGVPTGWADTSPWLKIIVDGVIMYTPKQPLRTNISRNGLNWIGLINGRSIELGGSNYIVRLMDVMSPGATVDGLTTNAATLPEKTDGSEYDKIFNMLTLHGTGQYSNADLGFSPSTRYVLGREKGTQDDYESVRRGNAGNVVMSDVFDISHALASDSVNVCWRPVLILDESNEPIEPGYELPPFQAYDGDTDTGYLGTFSATELFTGTELASEVGLTSGIEINDDVDWLGFYVGPGATCNKEGGKPYLLYVPMKPHRYTLSWDHINAAGVARGGVKTVSKGGHTYKVRLLSGGNSQNTQTDPVTNAEHPMQSEWNQLIYRVHQLVPNGTESGSGGPQVGDNWANFSDAELGINYQVSPQGSYSWCMEDWFNNSSLRVNRGNYSVAHATAATSSHVHTHFGWRPALVAVLD